MRNDWYRAWFDSPFYHKLYFNRDEKEAAQFISRLVNRLQPAAGRMRPIFINESL